MVGLSPDAADAASEVALRCGMAGKSSVFS